MNTTKILLILLLINSFNAYSDNAGISNIVLHLINIQTGTHKIKTMSYSKHKYPIVYFQLLKDQLYGYGWGTNPREKFLKNKLEDFQIFLDKYHCQTAIDEAVIHLMDKNSHNTTLEVTYLENNHYRYIYTEPLDLAGCNLTLVYYEKDLIKAASGSGYLTLFERFRFNLNEIYTKRITGWF